MQVNYRFLSSEDFAALHVALLEAFSDYIIPFQLTEAQLRNHIAVNAVDINQSVGAFAGEKMVGFTLNGFGCWNGKSTVYDAGTGVLPDFRGKRIAERIFEFMTPALKQNGVEQILLEVITKNESAVRLYRRLGFEKTRRLLLFERQKRFCYRSKCDFLVREISEEPDWQLLQSFWDGNTCWQNSIEATKRSLSGKIVAVAFADKEKCVGYGIVFPKSGSIAQIAVDKNYRRRGVASLILTEMQTAAGGADKPLRAANIDDNLKSTIGFLKSRNFGETLSQFEMIKTL
ncbi:MAG: GNAT family N-acetyltransferase [Acidobacteriota bacterium]|nr:GNAT family N-acetyltransferase [Acidobacteriota bacterium]